MDTHALTNTCMCTHTQQKYDKAAGNRFRLQATEREQWLTVTDGLDLDGLGDPLLWVGQDRFTAHLGFEQGIHQGGLPQAALP